MYAVSNSNREKKNIPSINRKNSPLGKILLAKPTFFFLLIILLELYNANCSKNCDFSSR